jgi:hypothetical protein
MRPTSYAAPQHKPWAHSNSMTKVPTPSRLRPGGYAEPSATRDVAESEDAIAATTLMPSREFVRKSWSRLKVRLILNIF